MVQIAGGIVPESSSCIDSALFVPVNRKVLQVTSNSTLGWWSDTTAELCHFMVANHERGTKRCLTISSEARFKAELEF